MDTKIVPTGKPVGTINQCGLAAETDGVDSVTVPVADADSISVAFVVERLGLQGMSIVRLCPRRSAGIGRAGSVTGCWVRTWRGGDGEELAASIDGDLVGSVFSKKLSPRLLTGIFSVLVIADSTYSMIQSWA